MTTTTQSTTTTIHPFCHVLAPEETFVQLEAAVERCYERVMDSLDAALMADKLDQSQYDQMSQQLKEWASEREAAIEILLGTMSHLEGTSELHDEASA